MLHNESALSEFDHEGAQVYSVKGSTIDTIVEKHMANVDGSTLSHGIHDL